MSRFQSGRIGQYKIQETRTVKRTLIATKINLAGWNVTLKEKTKKKIEDERIVRGSPDQLPRQGYRRRRAQIVLPG